MTPLTPETLRQEIEAGCPSSERLVSHVTQWVTDRAALAEARLQLREAVCECTRHLSDDIQADDVPGHHDFGCEYRRRMQPVLAALAASEEAAR